MAMQDLKHEYNQNAEAYGNYHLMDTPAKPEHDIFSSLSSSCPTRGSTKHHCRMDSRLRGNDREEKMSPSGPIGGSIRQECRIAESGRSMVEMLGTLAVIGVLSIGGIAGYSYGMDKYRANTIINDIMLRATDVIAQYDTTGDANLDSWPTTTVGDSFIALDNETLGINVMVRSERLCQMVFDGVINKASVKIANGDGSYTWYDTPASDVCRDGANFMTIYANGTIIWEDEENTETTTTTTLVPEQSDVDAVQCFWTDWINNDHPSDNADGGDIEEMYPAICKKEYVQDIECRSATEPYLSWETLGQKAQCNTEVGFVCKNEDQFGNELFGLCYDYEIRVYCCQPIK